MATKTLAREKPKTKSAIKVKRIICGASNASSQFANLRAYLSTDGEVVSPRHRKLTQAVFGKELTPNQVVTKICHEVHERGLSSVLHYTHEFDKVRLTPGTIRVTPEELKEAHSQADPELLDVVRRVRMNIISFQ